jgi:hypothetical protein
MWSGEHERHTPGMNLDTRLVARALAAAILVAGCLWAISWGFIAQTDGGTVRVLGLAEGAWRALLNPALAIIVAGAALTARRQPTAPSLVLLVGLAAMLVGNIVEFGLLGRATPIAGAGPAIFLAGAGAAIAALGWGAGRAVSAVTRRPRLAVATGVSAAAAVAIMTVAAPAAAALAVLALVDALWQAAPSAGLAFDDGQGAPSLARA